MNDEEIFNERAKMFIQEALDDLNKGFYDLAIFHAEQALQLKIKYLLAKSIGYYTKIHDLTVLIDDLAKIDQDLVKIMRDNIELIDDLKIAYIASRYLPIRYSKAKAERLVRFVDDILKMLDERGRKEE
ncbi:MAG: HEPN domain-containing protein [Candidatus Nitrosocaldus sp.]